MLFSGIAFAVMVIGVKTINGTIDSGLKNEYFIHSYCLLPINSRRVIPITNWETPKKSYQCLTNWHQQNTHH